LRRDGEMNQSRVVAFNSPIRLQKRRRIDCRRRHQDPVSGRKVDNDG